MCTFCVDFSFSESSPTVFMLVRMARSCAAVPRDIPKGVRSRAKALRYSHTSSPVMLSTSSTNSAVHHRVLIHM